MIRTVGETLDNFDEEIPVPYHWSPRQYQLKAWDFMEGNAIGPCYRKRAVLAWHRRCGKDLFGINYSFTQMVKRPGLYWHMFPTYSQGRKVIWEGFTKAGRRFMDYFPKQLVTDTHNIDMRLTLANGSVYQVIGGEDPDRLMGASPFGVIFSEFSLTYNMKVAWDLCRPMLAENGGWAMFIFTIRGYNHGWELLERARKLMSHEITEDEAFAITESADAAA